MQRARIPALVALLLYTGPLAIPFTVPATQTVDTSKSTAPSQVIQWLHNAAIPLRTTNPDADLADMGPLSAVVGNAQIVSMGEATHGTREFFQMKHRMLEFLVQKMGFTVFAIEANWPESLAVNDYVLNGTGDPAVALAGMYFWTWNTEEVLDMIRWMRKYNQNPVHTKKVQFLGFDMQTAQVAVSNVEDYLERVDRQEFRIGRNVLAPLADTASQRAYTYKALTLREKTSQGIQSLLEVFDDKKHAYVAASSTREWVLARHNLEIVKQAEDLYSPHFSSHHLRTVRDRYMAENVKWILDNEPAGTKMMLWAHNAHVWVEPNDQRDAMGALLRQMYGQRMVVCGFSFYQGSFRAVPQPLRLAPKRATFLVGPSPPETLDAALAETGFRLFAVDLRAAPPGTIRDWLHTPHPMRMIGAVYDEIRPSLSIMPVVPDCFDVIFFVNQTSPSRENPSLPRQIDMDFKRG